MVLDRRKMDWARKALDDLERKPKPRRRSFDPVTIESVVDQKHWDSVKKKYGISRDEFMQVLAEQEGKCWICYDPDGIVIDHDHETGSFRGLLCPNCNTILGLAKDSPKVLQRAMEYLVKHGKSN